MGAAAVVVAAVLGALKGSEHETGSDNGVLAGGGLLVRSPDRALVLDPPRSLGPDDGSGDARLAGLDGGPLALDATGPPNATQPAAVEPAPSRELGEIERIICSYSYDWVCDTALAVARCESGPDYLAGFSGPDVSGNYHAGTLQVSSIHAWRFAARGWDYWTDALMVERNIAVAYELWSEQGFWPWSCY